MCDYHQHTKYIDTNLDKSYRELDIDTIIPRLKAMKSFYTIQVLGLLDTRKLVLSSGSMIYLASALTNLMLPTKSSMVLRCDASFVCFDTIEYSDL